MNRTAVTHFFRSLIFECSHQVYRKLIFKPKKIFLSIRSELGNPENKNKKPLQQILRFLGDNRTVK